MKQYDLYGLSYNNHQLQTLKKRIVIYYFCVSVEPWFCLWYLNVYKYNTTLCVRISGKILQVISFMLHIIIIKSTVPVKIYKIYRAH